jgi:hypothetical protein
MARPERGIELGTGWYRMVTDHIINLSERSDVMTPDIVYISNPRNFARNLGLPQDISCI